ncbi:MAG: hypothetical protein QXY41_07055 [Thermoproteota archaeon]
MKKDKETLSDAYTELDVITIQLKQLLDKVEKLKEKIKDRILGWDILGEEE